jgi:hypothetical protein
LRTAVQRCTAQATRGSRRLTPWVQASHPTNKPDRSPNSDIAANKLVALGYTNVREYAEGNADWIEAGLPVESGVPARA